jgi:hypothetical protein
VIAKSAILYLLVELGCFFLGYRTASVLLYWLMRFDKPPKFEGTEAPELVGSDPPTFGCRFERFLDDLPAPLDAFPEVLAP